MAEKYSTEQALAMLKIAADSWDRLRKCDVERLITTYGREYAEHIVEERPDLAEECVDVCQSI